MPTIDLGSVVGPQGAQGATGARGPQGVQGSPGPNQITNSTSTTLSGVLMGSSGVVGVRAVDTTPTNLSTNLISSGGVASAMNALYSQTVNPNLLDNWYFVGGGSTQTEDRFPINSRELTTYTGLGYTIDRWKMSNSNTTVSLTAQGLTTSASSGAVPYLLQPISYQSELFGKTVTLSILTTSGLYYATATLPSTAPSSTSVYTNITNIGQILYLYSAGTGIWYVRFTGATDGGNTYIAAKLELGDTQTLAHQENGAWVLNELPSFAEQQMRCYRYYLRLPTYVRYPLTRYTSTTLDFIVPIPIKMRTTPTIENSSLFTVMSGTSAASGTYSFSVTGNGNNAIGIRAIAGSGTTVPSVSSGICLQISNGAALTAEL